jgi:redox-regulated HSP33 family molecular chaperone
MTRAVCAFGCVCVRARANEVMDLLGNEALSLMIVEQCMHVC